MPTIKEISHKEARCIQYDVPLYIWELCELGKDWFASSITPKDRRDGKWSIYRDERHYWTTHGRRGTQFGIAVDDTKPEYEPP